MPKPKLDLSPSDIAIIERAKTFKVTVFAGSGKYKSVERATARAWAPVLEKEVGNGKRAMIYAIDPVSDGSAFVPAAYAPEQSPMAAVKPPRKPQRLSRRRAPRRRSPLPSRRPRNPAASPTSWSG
ncbi:hypothetical protein [Bradyrhizobium sp. I1.7.5]|uniref:hypothetical protein n=1 Tax=Bradyrhizobium sp. I1.7.5 TaxID=3156363 RepID=UPI00339560E1